MKKHEQIIAYQVVIKKRLGLMNLMKETAVHMESQIHRRVAIIKYVTNIGQNFNLQIITPSLTIHEGKNLPTPHHKTYSTIDLKKVESKEKMR